MENVIVSNSVAKDFRDADLYYGKISRETAWRLMEGNLRTFFEFAKKQGWTKETKISDYVNKEHGAIYTAAFLKANGL